MKTAISERAMAALESAPQGVRRAFYKQLRFLVRNLQHPSLRAKKYDETQDIWQARVTHDWRFYFTIDGDTYRIQNITSHPK